MVVINHCNPHQLIAYPTVPLAQSVATSVLHDFAIGSFARFGNPLVTVSIQDRPELHDVSHYNMRVKLDLEDLLDDFLVIDERTADSHAIWYITSTETSKAHTAAAMGGDSPPITHEGEDFTLWQARVLTQDLPIQWACFDSGVRDIEDDIQEYNYPYDPHNPQDEPFTLGVDYSKKEEGQGFLPEAYIKADFDEIDWSTDINLRRRIAPTPPVVVQLTEQAARESGLVSRWRPVQPIPREGDTISTSAPYDWDSPKWSEDGTSVAKRGTRSLSLLSPGNDTSVRKCSSRMLLGPGFRRFRDLTNKDNVNALLFKNVPKLKTNDSQT